MKAWVKSEILTPKKLIFKTNNLYLDMYRQCEKGKKKVKKVKQDKKREKEQKRKKEGKNV